MFEKSEVEKSGSEMFFNPGVQDFIVEKSGVKARGWKFEGWNVL